MDPILIAIAFGLGVAVFQIGLPPLIGFLLAGFALNAMGFGGNNTLMVIGDLGVTLLLFSIGLKLKVKDLLQPEVWGGATVHMLLMIGFNFLILLGMMSLAIPLIDQASFQTIALLAFALSFSSTVFAVKILDSRGQMESFYGRSAIGILIMQDILVTK